MKNLKAHLRLVDEPAHNVKRILHFYTMDPTAAIMNHMQNMVETYGQKRVLEVIRHMIEAGDFNGVD